MQRTDRIDSSPHDEAYVRPPHPPEPHAGRKRRAHRVSAGMTLDSQPGAEHPASPGTALMGSRPAARPSPDRASSGRGVGDGAFGMESLDPVLSPGIMTAFPQGASLDKNDRIQVDSNASLVGGVAPTVRVPLDRDALARAMAGEGVQLAYAVAWIEAQAGGETGPAPEAVAGWVVAVWYGQW